MQESPALRGFEWAGTGDKDRRGPQVIQITGEVEDDMVQGVAEQTALAKSVGQKELLVYINSGGGSVHAALAILNIFANCGMKIVTCVTGCAASAACSGSASDFQSWPWGEVWRQSCWEGKGC